MKRFSFCLLAAIALCSSWSTAAQAQLVQVSPGYVRAPFVRVYTGPGGTYVRAPFVQVQSPRFGQRVPGPEQFARMDWLTLRETVRDLSEDLDDQLSNFSTGNSWKVHLKTAEIRALADDSDSPPSPGVVTQVQQILQVYDKTQKNESFRNIASLESFQGLYLALVEFSAPQAQRTGRQLSAAAFELNRQLGRSGAAQGWQRHLALPEGLSDPAKALRADELEKTLAKYNAVSANEQYRAIARLPAFQATHRLLAEYVELAKGPTPAPGPSPEELPAPPPQ